MKSADVVGDHVGALLSVVTSSSSSFEDAGASLSVIYGGSTMSNAASVLKRLLEEGMLYSTVHKLQATFLLSFTNPGAASASLRALVRKEGEHPAVQALASLMLSDPCSVRVCKMTPQQYLHEYNTNTAAAAAHKDEEELVETFESLGIEEKSGDDDDDDGGGDGAAAEHQGYGTVITQRFHVAAAASKTSIDTVSSSSVHQLKGISTIATTETEAIVNLLDAAVLGPLMPRDQAALLTALREKTSTVTVDTFDIVSLARHNPAVGVELFLCLGDNDHHQHARVMWMWALAEAGPPLIDVNLLSFWASLLDMLDVVEPAALAAFISNGVQSICQSSNSGVEDSRLVRIFSLFLQRVVDREDGVAEAVIMLVGVEVESFCMQFISVQSCAELYRKVLKMMEMER